MISEVKWANFFTAKYATILTHQTHLQLDFAARICIFNENYSNCQTAHVMWSYIYDNKTEMPRQPTRKYCNLTLTTYKPQEERHTKNIYKSDDQKHSTEGAI